MALLEDYNAAYIDIDELGVRPQNWFDEQSALDFDGYLSCGKDGYPNAYTPDFLLTRQGASFKLEGENKSEDDDDNDDDADYAVDPETGEKTFCTAAISSSHSHASSSSNDQWIEQYLSDLATQPSTSQHVPSVNSDFLLEQHAFSHYQPTNSYWSAPYGYSNTSYEMSMFADDKSHIPSALIIPRDRDNRFVDLLSVSADDDYSRSSSSTSSHAQRYLSSIESDSTSFDQTFDVHTKLEKIDRDEHTMASLLERSSSSARAQAQGEPDEATLRRYNIPLSVFDITRSSTEEYNCLLASLNHLSAEAMHVVKDIRRRGKNKIAAQNCRKRKASSVGTLLEEVDRLKRIRYELEERKRSYEQQIAETRHRYEHLHQQVLPHRQLLPAITVT